MERETGGRLSKGDFEGGRSAWSLRASAAVALVLLASSGVGGTAALTGCATAYKDSLGGKELQTFHRIFYTDFDTAWQSVLDSLKNARLDVSNRDAGLVQTLWTENTAEKNFVDSQGTQDAYLKAQFRVRITVAKGFFNGRPSVKVTVQKEQVVLRDVLEEWKPVDTDSIDENTLLYRIGRVISIRSRQAKLEQERVKSQMDSLQF